MPAPPRFSLVFLALAGVMVGLVGAAAMASDDSAPVMEPPASLASPVPVASPTPGPRAAPVLMPLPPVEPKSESPVLPGDLKDKPEQVTERFPDGSIKVEREVMLDDQGNYVNHGSFTMYAPGGKILRTGSYRNGKQHGSWTRYFDAGEGELFAGANEKDFAGPFVSEAAFADGRLHGIWTIKDKSQHKVVEWQFDNGLRSGKSLWFYPSGEKRREVTFQKGEPVGEMLEWDPNGEVTRRATFAGGRLLVPVIKWHGPGQKHYEGYTLTTQGIADVSFDWWNGTMTANASRKRGPDLKHGLWTVYYRNGQKMTQGEYHEDVPEGKFTWWYENGQKQGEGQYINGHETGVWFTWHRNGLKESRQEFQAGSLTGKWMRWNAEGQLAEVHDFSLEGPKSSDKPAASPPKPESDDVSLKGSLPALN